MKKILAVLLIGLILAAPAQARWHRNRCCYGSDVTAGIAGVTAGVILTDYWAKKQPKRVRKPKPRVYMAEPEAKCYTVVSRKTGKITQKCVEKAAGDIIYVD